LSVDYDGEPTEVQKWGFGLLNHRSYDAWRVGHYGRCLHELYGKKGSI